MKKGFTMVELLAVFTLAGIILLISVPKITSLLKNSDESSYESFLTSINIACEAYVEEKNISLNEENIITVRTLVESGYLKSTIKNPKNKLHLSDSVNLNKQISITKDDENVLKCILQD